MFRLIAILYVLVATVFAGVAVTAVLSLGHFGRSDIALSALAGAVIALPVAWLVGRHVFALTRNA
ncbi:hypothetical protein [Rhizobium sp. C4]|uniref:hypothetical protein n=1 Tax=Rhizobium sp. C4 TaxID=1349800 RepID=UPI001E5C5E4D|nr:hypothetical protein [Rhizobium sp. C4]MCD2173139.1 hypothetical protein [Rhizobium sp. C4]